MKNDKLLHTVIEGGEEALGFAKSRLLSLRQSTGKLGYADQFYKPFGENGPTVRVQITPHVDYIFISGSSDTILSGLVDQGGIIQVDGKNTLYRFYPSVEQAAAEQKTRAFRNEPSLAILPDASITLPSAGAPYAQSGTIAPAMFTGQMVYAVQALMGIKGKVAKYDWRASKTHGIMKSGGKPYLIEISADNGVMAMKLPTIKKLVGKNATYANEQLKNTLGYIPNGGGFPTGSDLTKAIASGIVRVLLAPSGLNGFYSKMPMYIDCGWAFSFTGNQAENTCWSWPDNYRRAHRFHISISADLNGFPNSATCTELESGYMYQGTLKETRFFVPAFTNEFSVATLDMRKAGTVGPVPASAWRSPLFVFYAGDTLQVIRQVATTNSNFDISEPKEVVPPPSGSVQSYYNDPIDTNPVFGPVIGYEGPNIEADANYTADLRVVDRFTIEDTGGYVYGDRNPGSAYTSKAFQGYLNRSTFSKLTKIIKSSVAISPRNRSGYFVAKSESNDWTASVYGSFREDFGVLRGDNAVVYGYNGGTFQVINSKATDDQSYPTDGFAGGVIVNSNNWPFALSAYELFFKQRDLDWAAGAPNHYHSMIGSIASASTSSPPDGAQYPQVYNITPDFNNVMGGSHTNILTTKFSNKTDAITMPAGPNFNLFYEQSPDIGGNFTLLNSGYSAFKYTRFYSKDANEIQTGGLLFSGDEPIQQCGARISFVGID